MSLFRGIADDLKLQDWLSNFIFPAEAKNVIAGFRPLGDSPGMPRNAALRHHYVHRYVLLRGRGGRSAKEAGMRGVLGETIIGFRSPMRKRPPMRLAMTDRFLQRFRQ